MLTLYQHELSNLYEAKINKDNPQHMKMLYDIYFHFFPYDKKINAKDKKWSKYIKK